MPRLANVPDAAETIASSLQLFLEPGQVTELRALGVSRPNYRFEHIEAGFYDAEHIEDMAAAAAEVMEFAKGVYFVPNPLNPDLLARINNRMTVAKGESLSSDKDVLCRRWMLIDADPKRIAGVSSTEEEKSKAEELVNTIRDHLTSLSWPSPIVADSGNGFHLLYRVDLPTQDNSLIQTILKTLSARFTTPHVTVDTAVYNPARIVKLYGTIARKGDSTSFRPHRASHIIENANHAA